MQMHKTPLRARSTHHHLPVNGNAGGRHAAGYREARGHLLPPAGSAIGTFAPLLHLHGAAIDGAGRFQAGAAVPHLCSESTGSEPLLHARAACFALTVYYGRCWWYGIGTSVAPERCSTATSRLHHPESHPAAQKARRAKQTTSFFNTDRTNESNGPCLIFPPGRGHGASRTG